MAADWTAGLFTLLACCREVMSTSMECVAEAHSCSLSYGFYVCGASLSTD